MDGKESGYHNDHKEMMNHRRVGMPEKNIKRTLNENHIDINHHEVDIESEVVMQ
jgi:hypothetical protein